MEKWQEPSTVVIWLTVIILVVVVMALSIITFISLYFKRMMLADKKLTATKLEYQKKLSMNGIKILERERRRISLDLHDNLINKLNVSVLMLGTSQIDDLKDTLQNCILEARNLSHEMQPPLLNELSLSELLEEMLEPIKPVYEITYRVFGDEMMVANDEKLQVVRITQEALNNIMKHSKANKLFIYLRFGVKGLCILIRDNGVGFEPTKSVEGLGLQNISLRVQILQGRYKFKSFPGRGTTLLVVFNYEK